MNKTKTLWKACLATYECDSSGVEGRIRKEITLAPTRTTTKREAKRILQPILDRVNAQAFNPTQEKKHTTLTEFSSVWERDYLSQAKPSTRPSMLGHLKRLKSAFGSRDLRIIGPADLQRFVSDLSAEGLAPKTIRNYWITLRLILQAALTQGYLEALPVKPKLPRAYRKSPRCFTLEEVGKIIEASERAGDFDAVAIYWTAAETGMRLGELGGIRTFGFGNGLEGGEVHVSETVWNGKRGTPKTNNAVRKIAISMQLRDRIKNDFTDFTSPFRDLPYHRAEKLQPLLQRLGIQKAGFHAFRHFNASLMDSLRIPLKVRQERLGHAATGSLTLDVYTHASYEDHMEAARLIGSAIEIAARSVSLTAV
jgi:integrase